MSYCLVLVTAKDKKQASLIARGVLSKKLAACVNMISGVESMFWWQGKIDKAKEVLLIMKTTKSCLKPLETVVKSLHSYQTPEFLVIDNVQGSKDYLAWIRQSTKV